jgi:hypothetical protein
MKNITALSIALLLSICWIAVAAYAEPSEQDTPWSSWKSLRMRANSIPFFSGVLEMRRSTSAGKVSLETSSTARFFGARIAHSETVSVLNAATGCSEKYESFSKKRSRRYAFGDGGYIVEKHRRRESGSWEIDSRKEFAYPASAEGSKVDVFDYFGMLLYLGHVELREIGDEVILHVATSKGPQPYRIKVGEVRSTTRSFTDSTSGEERTLPLRELRLRIIPADPENADEGFLKMEGETELWVEAESKTPLLLSGKNPKIPGRIKLVLSEIG